ncbi:MAG: hypothetical protein NTW14_04800 [bacterium]|nr:hypothetical protein [bacterium]
MQRMHWLSGWRFAQGVAWVLLLGIVGLTIAEISSYTGVTQFYGTTLALTWSGNSQDHHYRINLTEQDMTITPPAQTNNTLYSQSPSLEIETAPGRQYSFTVQAVSAAGDTSPSSEKSPTYLCLGGGNLPESMAEVSLPTTTELGAVYPNPFNSQATIPFDIATADGLPVNVALVIYNTQGRTVKNLVHEGRRPGQYRETWNGTNDQGNIVAAGPYICRLQAGNFSDNRVLVFVK